MENEKRLIDANEFMNEYWQGINRGEILIYNPAIRLLIENVPTVDAVEVVRCKDCKHWCDSWVAPDGKNKHGYCHMEESDDVIVGRWGDDFCSYGERRNNE